MSRLLTMRAFVTVVNEGTFTRAADRMGISPQLASKYVSQLEQALGVRLLNRTTRRLHLTEAGAGYHQRAQQVLNEIDEMESELHDLQGRAQGLLRISAPVSFALRHMVPLLTDFQKAHPGVGIDLQLNDRKVDIVDEGFDVALRIGRLRSSSLIARRIAPVRLLMCASPEYLEQHGTPQRPEDLKEHRYLRYSLMEHSNSDQVGRWLQETGGSTEGGLVSNNGDVLLESAIAGAGIVLQPSFIAGAAIKAKQLQVVLPAHETEPLGLYAVYAHRQLLASKVRRFVDFLAGYFGDPPYWDKFE